MNEITVLYDNRAGDGVRPGWGFAAAIRTPGALVLFDTGADKLVLEQNAAALGVDLDAVTALALSHEHCDHVGALSSAVHRGLHLYVPAAFAKRYASAGSAGVALHRVKRPTDIVPGVRSTGQISGPVPEQALLVDSSDGPALVTGCAHSGILRVARRAIRLAGGRLGLVVGGFHLFRQKPEDLERTVRELAALPIARLAPCHCTGEKGIAALKEAFAERFVEVVAGTRIPL